jgi:predicted Zn-dependent protease
MPFNQKTRSQSQALFTAGSLLLSLLTASTMPPAVVAQQLQPFTPTNAPGADQASTTTFTPPAPSNGIPTNLTPQQKYLRDVFLFKKLKIIDDLIKQDHHVQARQILEELVTLDPNPYSKDVHGLLAESCYKLGNNPEAIKNYELTIQYDNDKNVQTYWNIALAYMNMNDYDQATHWCKRLLARNPPDDLRRQAERFLNDVGKERSEQKDAFQQGPDGDGEGDYLNHLASSNEANRWPREKIPIKVFIEDDRNVPGFRSQFVEIFLNSLEIWTKATKNRLSFQIVNNLSQADLSVVFTANVEDIAQKPGMAPAEQGLASIRAYRRGPGYGFIERAKIQILVHKPTSNKELTDDDIKEVCLHEIGHAMGLSGHSPNDSDVMHFMLSFRQLPALTKRDKQTIARLYQDYPALNQTASANYQPSHMNTDGQYQPQFAPQQYQQPTQQQYQQPPQQQYQQPPQQQYQQPPQQQYQQQPPQQQYQQPPQQQYQQPPQQQDPGQVQYQGQPQNQNQSEFPTLQQFQQQQNQNQSQFQGQPQYQQSSPQRVRQPNN